ncbi:hypothetical protein QJQ45_007063, partial [Haematococcus lacustris]
VETIGDAIMIASGHDGVHDHALRMLAMARSMLQHTWLLRYGAWQAALDSLAAAEAEKQEKRCPAASAACCCGSLAGGGLPRTPSAWAMLKAAALDARGTQEEGGEQQQPGGGAGAQQQEESGGGSSSSRVSGSPPPSSCKPQHRRPLALGFASCLDSDSDMDMESEGGAGQGGAGQGEQLNWFLSPGHLLSSSSPESTLADELLLLKASCATTAAATAAAAAVGAGRGGAAAAAQAGQPASAPTPPSAGGSSSSQASSGTMERSSALGNPTLPFPPALPLLPLQQPAPAATPQPSPPTPTSSQPRSCLPHSPPTLTASPPTPLIHLLVPPSPDTAHAQSMVAPPPPDQAQVGMLTPPHTSPPTPTAAARQGTGSSQLVLHPPSTPPPHAPPPSPTPKPAATLLSRLLGRASPQQAGAAASRVAVEGGPKHDAHWDQRTSAPAAWKVARISSLFKDTDSTDPNKDDGPHRTPPVTPDQGVKQGCPISPLLFALYVHDISKEFLGPVDAVRVQGTPVTHFMYADDLTLVSTSPHGLQRLVCQLQGFADRKHLTVIGYKHEILPVVREFKYLGMHFNPSATPAFAAAHMRAGMFLAMRQACKRARQYGVLQDPYALCHLIRAFVLPLGLYGSQVWGTAFLGHGMQLSNQVQTRMLSFLRFAARVRSSVSGLMVLHELGQLPLQLYWLRAACKFWNTAKLSHSDLLMRVIKADVELGRSCQASWSAQFQLAARELMGGEFTLSPDMVLGTKAREVKWLESRTKKPLQLKQHMWQDMFSQDIAPFLQPSKGNHDK